MECLGFKTLTKHVDQLKAESLSSIILQHFEDLGFEGDIAYDTNLQMITATRIRYSGRVQVGCCNTFELKIVTNATFLCCVLRF